MITHPYLPSGCDIKARQRVRRLTSCIWCILGIGRGLGQEGLGWENICWAGNGISFVRAERSPTYWMCELKWKHNLWSGSPVFCLWQGEQKI